MLNTTSAQPTTSADYTPADPSKPTGGTVVIAVTEQVGTINPATDTGSNAKLVGCKIYDGLVRVNGDATQVSPELATSWTISPDGKTYTFNLRKGVQWHDGKPFTSADVKYSLEKVNPLNGQAILALEFIETITAPDDYTIVIQLKKPFGPFLYGLHACTTPIVAKHQAEAEPGVELRQKVGLNRAPIGTGPFMFVEWVAGQRIEVKKNPNYWKKGLPYLDGIVFPIINSVPTMHLAFERGEVNYVPDYWMTKEAHLKFQADGRFVLLDTSQEPSMQFLMMNLRHPALGKVEVRKAIYQAIDQVYLRDKVWLGIAEIGTMPIDQNLKVSANPDVDLTKMYPFDPAASKRLLDGAGFPVGADGTRMTLNLVYEANRAPRQAAAEVIQANLAAVGIKMNIVPLERAAMSEQVFRQHGFDFFLHGYTSRGDPYLGVARAYTCEAPSQPNSGNPTGYCNKDLDALWEKSAEGDFNARNAIYRQIQAQLAKDIPILPLISDKQASAGDKKFDYSVPHQTAGTGGRGWEYVYKLQ